MRLKPIILFLLMSLQCWATERRIAFGAEAYPHGYTGGRIAVDWHSDWLKVRLASIAVADAQGVKPSINTAAMLAAGIVAGGTVAIAPELLYCSDWSCKIPIVWAPALAALLNGISVQIPLNIGELATEIGYESDIWYSRPHWDLSGRAALVWEESWFKVHLGAVFPILNRDSHDPWHWQVGVSLVKHTL